MDHAWLTPERAVKVFPESVERKIPALMDTQMSPVNPLLTAIWTGVFDDPRELKVLEKKLLPFATGFAHTDLDKAPTTRFTNPEWATSADIDYAGNNPTNIVRIGSDNGGYVDRRYLPVSNPTSTFDSETKQVALSYNSGSSWDQHYGAPDGVQGRKVALSANGNIVLWSTASGQGFSISKGQAIFTSVSSLPANAIIASDKKDNNVFYGASGSS
uniref:Putative CEL6 protein n=1 Tax=Moniliophthora roreri TaxID=221103 RepID=A0A0W0FZL7_MONRR